MMNRFLRKSGLWLLSLLMAAMACDRPEPVTTGDLEVVVTGENGAPLPGVKLGLGELDYKYTTDANGSCLFKDLNEGFIRLYGRMEGYHDGTILAKVVAGETSRCDFPLKKVEPYLRWLDDGNAIVDTYVAKGRAGINLESNTSWAIEGETDNIIFHLREGEGNGNIDFEWDFPESIQLGDTLSRSIFVKGAGQSLEAKVIFHVPIRVLNISAREQNILDHPDDNISGVVEFNRRVEHVDFRPHYGAEVTRLRASDPEERKYPFHFKRVKSPHVLFVEFQAQSVNYDGLTFHSDSVALGLWDRSMHLEGAIYRTWLSADETFLWATYGEPDGVSMVKIDTRSLEIVKKFPISLTPGDFCYNYANNRLYVIDKEKSRVVVFNPDNGKTVKTIRVTDNPFQDDEPIRNPYRILFADNGFGILTLCDNYNSHYRWRIIDSREDDKMYVHPDCMQHFADGGEAFTYDVIDNWELCDLDLDHTRTQIIAGPPSERRYLHFFNSVDNTHESTITSVNISYFLSSREHDTILLMGPYGLSSLHILDWKSGIMTPSLNFGPSYLSDGSFAFDFCHGTHMDRFATYLFSSAWSYVMDNTNAKPVFQGAGREDDFNRLIAFRSGDRLLLISYPFGGGTDLVEFDTKRFFPDD